MGPVPPAFPLVSFPAEAVLHCVPPWPLVVPAGLEQGRALTAHGRRGPTKTAGSIGLNTKSKARRHFCAVQEVVVHSLLCVRGLDRTPTPPTAQRGVVTSGSLCLYPCKHLQAEHCGWLVLQARIGRFRRFTRRRRPRPPPRRPRGRGGQARPHCPRQHHDWRETTTRTPVVGAP